MDKDKNLSCQGSRSKGGVKRFVKSFSVVIISASTYQYTKLVQVSHD
jgi:hypothetical protein